MKSILAIGLAICLVGSITGCGGYSSPSGSTGRGLLAGNWQFTYVSHTNGSSTVSGTITEMGNNFSATVTLTNSCAATAMLSGTLNGYALTGTITEASPETINVTGTVATGGGTASGTYQVMSATGACAAASGDTGTWSGTRTSVPVGPYGGMMRSADRLPVQVNLNLKDSGSGRITGIANFTNSACLHSLNVTGTISGVNLELRGDGRDSSVVLTGATDKDAEALTLTSAISGACQAESGVATLSKLQ